MKFRIVNTDNFGGDYPNESFVGETFSSKAEAEAKADKLNGPDNGAWRPRFYKVVKDGYELQPGFEP